MSALYVILVYELKNYILETL